MIGFDAHCMLAPTFLPDMFLAPERIATLRLASAGLVSAPGDTPALAFYEPRILEGIEIGQSAADALAVGGRVALAVSEIALAHGDNFAADLARYGAADGCAVRVLSLADTGLLSAEAQDESQGNVVLVFPAPVTARYLRVDLTDGAAPYMDIGLLVAGQLWRLQRDTDYGIREGRVMLGRRDRNPHTGAEFPVPAIVNPRMAAFTLPALSTAEARNQHRDMLRHLGVARDTLWIAEITGSMAKRNCRAIWGAMNAPGEDAAISWDCLPLASRGFRLVERV